jgi:hypothetical protein
MATKKKTTKKTATENPDRVAVLRTHVGIPLFIRANPSEEAVRGFVEEHNRRYHAGEPGGPSGQPAYLILGASYYDSEDAYYADPDSGVEISL